MNYYLQDQNKSPVKSRSTSLTLREHIQKWTDRLNTLFILKHLRDLKVLQCFYLLVYWAASLKSNSRSPTPSCDVTEVTRKCLLKHYLHYWKKWKISRCALYMINNFLFELSKNIKLHNNTNTNTTTQRPEEMFVDNGLYHQFDTSIFSSMEK